MDLSKYLELYLTEGREHLAALRSGLPPEGPPNAAAVNEIFRHAHSLKGMAASMDFECTSSLSHTLESLLGLWRQGRPINREHIDAVVRTLDVLESLMDSVQRDGSDVSGREAAAASGARLQAMISDEPPPSEGPEEPATEPSPSRLPVEGPVPDDLSARLSVGIDPASPLPAARLLVVLQKIRENCGTVRMEPDIVAIQSRNLKSAVFNLLPSPQLKDLARSLRDLPEVVQVSLDVPVRASTAGKSGPTLVPSIRVRSEDLDGLLNQTGELLNHLNQFEAGLTQQDKRKNRFWLEAHRSRMDRLFDQVLSIRLVPFDALVERLGRTVRELADRLSKRVLLEVEGADQKVDQGLLEKLLDPLAHLVRNAMDHGMESAEDRAAAGKNEAGLIKLEISREAEALIIKVEDDGRGLDPEVIRQTAVERGLLTPQDASSLDRDKLFRLLTTPAFSTRKEVTEVSGRGVGLDVVRSAVESLGGHLEIESTLGKGSRFLLVVPSAVTLTSVLIFGWRDNSARFGLPASQVKHIYPLSSHAMTWSGDRRLLQVGNELLPVIPWRLGPVGRDGVGLRLSVQGRDRILLVSEVFQGENVVIHPWGSPLEMVPGWMGGALLSTGEVAYVLDGRIIAKYDEKESHALSD